MADIIKPINRKREPHKNLINAQKELSRDRLQSICFKINDELHRKLKVKCAMNKTTITTVIEDLLIQYTKDVG